MTLSSHAAPGAALLLLLAPSCSTICTAGSGEVATETREVPPFHTLVVSSSADVVAAPLAAGTLELETDDNLLVRVTTEVEGGTLVIDTRDGCIDPTRGVRVRVAFGDLEAIVIEGSGDVVCEEPLRVAELSVVIEGSGDVRLGALDAGKVGTVIEGSGDVTYAGRAARHEIRVDGSGDVDASALETEASEVFLGGSGDCFVAVSDELVVTIEGSGDVRYRGEPERMTLRVEGSGSLYELPLR